MSPDHVPMTVRILDKEYRIACPQNEQAGLLTSADYLNKRMKEIRDSGKAIGADRVAVLAALNLTHELLNQKAEREKVDQAFGIRLESLQQRIDVALGKESLKDA